MHDLVILVVLTVQGILNRLSIPTIIIPRLIGVSYRDRLEGRRWINAWNWVIAYSVVLYNNRLDTPGGPVCRWFKAYRFVIFRLLCNLVQAFRCVPNVVTSNGTGAPVWVGPLIWLWIVF